MGKITIPLPLPVVKGLLIVFFIVPLIIATCLLIFGLAYLTYLDKHGPTKKEETSYEDCIGDA